MRQAHLDAPSFAARNEAGFHEDLGAVANAEGRLALLYLAGQIRQNTRASRAETYQGLSSQFASTVNSIGSSLESTRVYNTGLRDYAELTEEERTQFVFSMHAAFAVFESAFYMQQYGALEHELGRKWASQLEWYTQRAGVITWWKSSESFFGETFRDHVNDLIASEENSTR